LDEFPLTKVYNFSRNSGKTKGISSNSIEFKDLLTKKVALTRVSAVLSVIKSVAQCDPGHHFSRNPPGLLQEIDDKTGKNMEMKIE
jgi:hypothetical protein